MSKALLPFVCLLSTACASVSQPLENTAPLLPTTPNALLVQQVPVDAVVCMKSLESQQTRRVSRGQIVRNGSGRIVGHTGELFDMQLEGAQ